MDNLQDTIDKYKNLPKEEPKFKYGQVVVIDLIDEVMVVLNEQYDYKIINNVWVPILELGYTNKDITLNKVKRHRFFPQNSISMMIGLANI